jgi:hypothetical protein
MMKYILIMWLSTGTPVVTILGSAEACVLARDNFLSFSGGKSTHSVAFCTPQSGEGKILDDANFAVNPGNR